MRVGTRPSGHTEGSAKKKKNAMEETEKKSLSTMECLPLELQQEILTQLSLQDLARLRCTKKSQQAVVNSSSKYLSKQLCIPEFARLQAYVGYHFDCKNDQVDLLESLRRFFAHRPYAPPYPGPAGLAADFTKHWIDQHHGDRRSTITRHSEADRNDHTDDCSDVETLQNVEFPIWAFERLICRMMSIHVRYHAHPSLTGLWPYGSRSHDSLADDMTLACLELSNNACGIDKAILGRWETDLVDLGLANLSRDARQRNFLHGPGFCDGGIPKYALTPLTVRWAANRRTWFDSMGSNEPDWGQHIDGICSVSKLVEILGVPSLADNGLFAYCVKSERAFKQVQRAVGNGKEIDGLVKVMVLKETFVF
ncbi:hypothetical protein HII31_03268 [Pseudocercospora fuligena]|uniref:F-box domain-containing protein n=1 Tax=Pseudocercospora fuligena TaxID=685502 RepID=A0A8H6RN31_9PEZI|nr:hypothetical protein HII31_03268 [Pseudocercospora fuligena]